MMQQIKLCRHLYTTVLFTEWLCVLSMNHCLYNNKFLQNTDSLIIYRFALVYHTKYYATITTSPFSLSLSFPCHSSAASNKHCSLPTLFFLFEINFNSYFPILFISVTLYSFMSSHRLRSCSHSHFSHYTQTTL